MTKKMIDRVTVTGADDSVDANELVEIQKRYPFVEWGILLSKTGEGKLRFPSREWLDKLIEVKKVFPLHTSGHLCGRWVRDICNGENTLFDDRSEFEGLFDRYQLNFHAYAHRLKDQLAFANAVRQLSFQVILQFDKVNDDLLMILREKRIDVAALFDTSGGAGVLPNEWPEALEVYSGYAGGLSPENLNEQMELVSKVCGDKPIWIDAETRLRSDFDRQFDLDRVVLFLEQAKPWLVD